MPRKKNVQTPWGVKVFQGVTKRNRCRVCGRPDWCEISDDGTILCNRIQKSPLPDVKSDHQYIIDGQVYIAQKRKENQAFFNPLNNSGIVPQKQEIKKYDEAAEAVEHTRRDALYRDLMAAMDEVSVADQAFIAIKYGLDGIREARSMNARSRKAANDLLASDSRFYGLPGVDDDAKLGGSISMNGIIYPLKDLDGNWYSLQTRVTATRWTGPKYLIARDSNGTYSIEHGPQGAMDAIAISEGTPKTLRAIGQNGVLAEGIRFGVALVGYANTEVAVRNALLIREKHSTNTVLLMLDAEDKTRETQQQMGFELALIGFEVLMVTWDGSRAKGIDDALNMSVKITTSEYKIDHSIVEKNGYKLTDAAADEMYKQMEASKPTQDQKTKYDPGTAEWKVDQFVRDLSPVANYYTGTHLAKAATGSGKSTALKKIPLYLGNINAVGQPKRALIALENHEKIDEYILTAQNPHHITIAHYHGRNKVNCVEHEKVAKIQAAGWSVSDTVCQKCPLHGNGCAYEAQRDEAEQADLALIAKASLRYALHDKYIQPLGRFDFRYVDEDATSEFYSDKIWTYEDVANFLGRAKAELAELTSLAAQLTGDEENEHFEQIQQTEIKRMGLTSTIKIFETIKKSMEDALLLLFQNRKHHKADEPIKNLDALGIDVKDIEAAYTYTLNNTGHFGLIGIEKAPDLADLERSDELTMKGIDLVFDALRAYAIGDKDASNQAYIQTVGSKVQLKLRHREDGLIGNLREKAVFLDASANEEIYRRHFPDIKITKIDIAITQAHQFVHVGNISGSERAQARESYFDRIGNFLRSQVNDPAGLGIVCKKALADRMRAADWEKFGDRIEHYGAGARGSNRLEDKNTFLDIQHTPNLNELYIKYQAISGERFEMEFEEIYTFDKVERKLVRRKVAKNKGFREFIKSEIMGHTYQAIGRARLTQREKVDPKTGEKGPLATIYYVGDTYYWPDDLPVFTHKIKAVAPKKRKQAKKTKTMLTNMQKTAEEIKKAIKQMKNKVDIRAYLKLVGKWNTAQKLAEKLDISAKTIMRYFSDLTFWRIFEAAKVGQVDEKDVMRYLVAILARRMRLSGEIKDESILLSRL